MWQPRVGRSLVGGVFRLHHRMADRAAERGGVHDLDGFEGRRRQDDDVEQGQGNENDQPLAGLLHVEVEDRKMARTALLRCQPLVFPVDADRYQDQAGDEYQRQEDECENAEVGTALQSQRLHDEQGDEQGQAGDRKRGADQADRVPDERGEEMSGHIPSSAASAIDVIHADRDPVDSVAAPARGPPVTAAILTPGLLLPNLSRPRTSPCRSGQGEAGTGLHRRDAEPVSG